MTHVPAAGRRPRVTVLRTGGTLGASGADPFDRSRYGERHVFVGGEGGLTESLGLEASAEVQEIRFRDAYSHELTESDWLDLARTIDGIAEGQAADAVVITHGTNTIEETAYFLSLVLSPALPVVLVGAMRPWDVVGSDGAMNLRSAVLVAASPAIRGAGPIVVSDGSIFAARDVTKVSTMRLDAFAGRDFGPSGYLTSDDAVVIGQAGRPRDTPLIPLQAVASLPRVDVIASYIGSDGSLIDAAVSLGARGIVSAGTGAGWPTPLEAKALSRAADRGVIVCQSTRVASGYVPKRSLSAERRWLSSGNLSPWKARILLAVALGSGADLRTLGELFDREGGHRGDQ